MKNRQGLVPVKKLVVRNGKSFIQTVYVRPGAAKKVDNSKSVYLANLVINTLNDLLKETNRIKNIKDVAEKEIQKDHLLKELKKKGIKWKEDKNRNINYMRALMAAKKHFSGQQQKAQNQQKQNQTQSPFQTKTLDKASAKAIVDDLKKKYGSDKLVEMIKKAGITWKEHSHVGVNKMRAFMALREHIQAGKSIEALTGEKPVQQQVESKQKEEKKKDKNEPKEGTREHAYYHASPRGKILAYVSGIVPTDKQAEDFLFEKLTNSQINWEEQLPKKYQEALNEIRVRLRLRTHAYVIGDAHYQPILPNHKPVTELFEGTPHFKDYLKYAEASKKVVTRYGENSVQLQGASFYHDLLKGWDFVEKEIGIKLEGDVTGAEVFEAVKNYFNRPMSKEEKRELYDKLQVGEFLESGAYVHHKGMLSHILGMAYSGLNNREFFIEPFAEAMGDATTLANDIKRMVDRGQIDKSEVIDGIAKTLNRVKDGEYEATRFKEVFRSLLKRALLGQTIVFDPNDIQLDNLKNFVEASDATYKLETKKVNGKEKVYFSIPASERSKIYEDEVENHYGPLRAYYNNAPSYGAVPVIWSNYAVDDFSKLKTRTENFLKDVEPINNPIGRWIGTNLKVYGIAKNFGLKTDEWELLPMNDYLNATNDGKYEIIAKHLYKMRYSKKTREKRVQALEKEHGGHLLSYLRENKPIPENVLPNLKDASKKIKSVISTVNPQKLEEIKTKIKQDHDKKNHGSFAIAVHNVYEVKNLPIEEEFQRINQERDNTGLYYHGTDYDRARLILGESGQFKVFKSPDKVKAGRMLGDGVYLAAHSSKSAQYISSSFGRGQDSGILFLCEASLGRVKESFTPGHQHNQKYFDRGEADTIYMTRPLVKNPEWCVADPKAVAIRYVVDIERYRRR